MMRSPFRIINSGTPRNNTPSPADHLSRFRSWRAVPVSGIVRGPWNDVSGENLSGLSLGLCRWAELSPGRAIDINGDPDLDGHETARPTRLASLALRRIETMAAATASVTMVGSGISIHRCASHPPSRRRGLSIGNLRISTSVLQTSDGATSSPIRPLPPRARRLRWRPGPGFPEGDAGDLLVEIVDDDYRAQLASSDERRDGRAVNAKIEQQKLYSRLR